MKHKWFAIISLIVIFAMIMPTTGISASGPHDSLTLDKRQDTLSLSETTSEILINEVMFYPEEGDYEWVELKNNGSVPVSINSWGLTDEDGNWYRFPSALPEVPIGALIVVIFDGLGSSADEYDFLDDVVILHSQMPLVDIFEDSADQVALYRYNVLLYLPFLLNKTSSETGEVISNSGSPYIPPIESFIAWGADPGDDALNAYLAGLNTIAEYIDIERAPGYKGLTIGGSIGIIISDLFSAYWGTYYPSETSLGSNNVIPGPTILGPIDDITTCNHQMTFVWTNEGVLEYTIEIDDQSDFSSPLEEANVVGTSYQQTSQYPDGIYYVRVKALGDNTAYSHTVSFSYIYCSEQLSSILPITLDVPFLLQHKDTRMLNFDGASNDSGGTEFGSSRWDSAHEEDGDWIVGDSPAYKVSPIDDSYCTRAAIAMIASYYGKQLSQDRISYYAFGEGAPEGDLGGGRGLWPNQLATRGGGKNVFSWAMNDAPILSSTGKPTIDQVVEWIDAGRPVLIVTLSDTFTHSMVINGYWDMGGQWFVYVRDPSNYFVYPLTWNELNIVEYHVPPSSVSPRFDENDDGDTIADTIDDSDGDGVVDFDENYRFSALNDLKPDSDNDGITDKDDIREYVFDNSGVYSWRSPDLDGDILRKEVDYDNDNDGSSDGCEDTDRDGLYEPEQGETSNFDSHEANNCNPLPSEHIYIPAGAFLMGCDQENSSSTCISPELPLHYIYLSAYRIDATEVTNAQYARCVSAGVCTPPSEITSYTREYYYGNPDFSDYPVIRVTWEKAQEYCSWVGGSLPTEAQWEKAARGNIDTRLWPWGDELPNCTLANSLNINPCVGDTSPVGSYPLGASIYGVLDMAGNVNEWVYDWYDSDYYEISPYYNPTGPVTGNYRIVRGGCYRDQDYTTRVAYREDVYPNNSSIDWGFRCAYPPNR